MATVMDLFLTWELNLEHEQEDVCRLYSVKIFSVVLIHLSCVGQNEMEKQN